MSLANARGVKLMFPNITVSGEGLWENGREQWAGLGRGQRSQQNMALALKHTAPTG